jgi:hypothetical protein
MTSKSSRVAYSAADTPICYATALAGLGNQNFQDRAGVPHQHSPAFRKPSSEGTHYPSRQPGSGRSCGSGKGYTGTQDEGHERRREIGSWNQRNER